MEKEIKIWQKMAELEVATAKELAGLSNSYLFLCICNVRNIIQNENPYALPTSDARYRSFVIAILQEYQRQELPDFENFFANVLYEKYLKTNVLATLSDPRLQCSTRSLSAAEGKIQKT